MHIKGDTNTLNLQKKPKKVIEIIFHYFLKLSGQFYNVEQLITFGGKPLDLIIYIIINKTCAASMLQKYISGPLGPPKIMCSHWLH